MQPIKGLIVKNDFIHEHWQLWFSESNRTFQHDDAIDETFILYKEIDDFFIEDDKTIKFCKPKVAIDFCRNFMRFSIEMGLPEPQIELWHLQFFSDHGWDIKQRHRIQFNGDLILLSS